MLSDCQQHLGTHAPHHCLLGCCLLDEMLHSGLAIEELHNGDVLSQSPLWQLPCACLLGPAQVGVLCKGMHWGVRLATCFGCYDVRKGICGGERVTALLQHTQKHTSERSTSSRISWNARNTGLGTAAGLVWLKSSSKRVASAASTLANVCSAIWTSSGLGRAGSEACSLRISEMISSIDSIFIVIFAAYNPPLLWTGTREWKCKAPPPASSLAGPLSTKKQQWRSYPCLQDLTACRFFFLLR
jgi:hypothetical protein